VLYYRGNLQDIEDPEPTRDVRVYALAVKFGLKDLESLAFNRIQQ
jgi:hypothetical protein